MRGSKIPALIATGGMELSWLYAWATFLTSSILHQPFPFPEAVGSFVLAAVLTQLSEGRGWRVVYILCIQAVGFIPAIVRMVHVLNSWQYSFSNQTWFTELFQNSRASLDWFIIILVVSWASVFWGGGVRLIRRPVEYLTICSRFDRGLGAFFVLFLTKFLFLVKGGVTLDEPMSEFLLFPFLVFSLLAIGLTRIRTTALKSFLPGYQGIGVILSFTVIVLFFGAGIIFFFLPYLTQGAEKGYEILKIAAGPLGSIFLTVIRFLFGGGRVLEDGPPAKPEPKLPEFTPSGKSPWWLELFGNIMAYGLWIILGLTFLTLIGVALYFLFRWLLSRTPVDQQRQPTRYMVLQWLERLRRLLGSCWSWFVRRFRGYEGAVHLYTALLNWGRRSGLRHVSNETPTEYGSRLKNCFPVIQNDIERIVDAFNEEVYREVPVKASQLVMAHAAWRRMRSPVHWPRRLKTWFLRH